MGGQQVRTKGLEEDIRRDSVVLILGTLPGEKSIQNEKYYAGSTNGFWDILFQACGEPFDKSDEAKKLLLENYKIALWDVLKSAKRKSSKDKDIIDETPKDLEPSDIPGLLSDYPELRLILFHSNDTYKFFRRFFKNTSIPYIRVASPSGLNRASMEEKAQEWRAALSCVIPQLQTGHKLEWKKPRNYWYNSNEDV